MNEKQKIQKKIEKFGRQLGFTASKMIRLAKENIIYVKGNGVYITIKNEAILNTEFFGRPANERIKHYEKNETVGLTPEDQSKVESIEECNCKKPKAQEGEGCKKIEAEKQEEK